MKKLLLSTVMLLCAVNVNAADFKVGEWFGEQDWSNELCRMYTHVGENNFFFVENDWHGTFKIGIREMGNPHYTEGYKAIGLVLIDGKYAVPINGEGKGEFITFDSNHREALKMAFTVGHYMFMTYDDTKLQLNLSGTAKAMKILDVCAKETWPGAGDSEESETSTK